MLFFRPLKNHAGIVLFGARSTVLALERTVLQVNEKSILIQDEDGALLEFAEGLGLARDGMCSVIPPPEQSPETGYMFGVEMLWPELLVLSRMLRASLAYFDSNKEHQAITYALENVIEQAVEFEFGSESPFILERWSRIDPTHPYAEDVLHTRMVQFCKWTKKQRRTLLTGMLISFNPMYPAMYPYLVESGEKGLIAPEDYDALEWEEIVDPRD